MDTTDQFLVEEDDYVLVERAGTVPGPQEAGGSDSDGGGEEGGEETDPVRLAQREKQVMYGKNTQAYQNYVRMVPRHKRKLRGKDADPQTPDIKLKASKRCWAGLVRKWRRSLHAFDPQEGGDSQSKQPAPQQPLPQQTPPQQTQPQQKMQQQTQQQKQQPKQRKQQARQQPQDRRRQQGAQAHAYLQPVQQDQAWAPSSVPPGSDGAGGVRKLTPSKRQHRTSPAPGAHDDGSGAWQRDTTSKRICAAPQQESRSAAAGASSSGPPPKSWADAVDDAFGEWDD
ncbi:hypothetical protein Rsub_12894 [Raphidocelis subcapitata]|uniref:Histone RNA hairpin-binding protein RNA-binding domain-containing protein n=1 Tax=Raphidocelis subcapitata TaxID=307507 RepID=A0A2V0PL23_9CHLO|nr:hypothetical protein Rsub_12894 [Raphidocelis subcapitata]|eukprot:GBG00250.1 hypothetical protein Rsub_12894 [Raphidocelis subcapitata]